MAVVPNKISKVWQNNFHVFVKDLDIDNNTEKTCEISETWENNIIIT